MERDYTIFAIKTVQPGSEHEKSISIIYDKLKQGEATFSWAWFDEADLRKIKETIDKDGWDALTDDQKDVWKHTWFLLEEVKIGDYFIYINMPEYGKCTLVKITGDYTFSEPLCSNDFRHLRPCEFIKTFDRSSVPNYLRRRLGLQGAWWRVYAYEDFEALLADEIKSDEEKLEEEIDKHLEEIAMKMCRRFPGKNLEPFLMKVFKKMPGVKAVRKGPDKNGADLEIEFERGLDIEGLQRPEVCAVQVKSYEGKMGYIQAINDIRKAFKTAEDYGREYSCGLIVSTALEMTPEFEDALQKLKKDTGKDVGILLGKDLARMVVKYIEE